MADYTQCEEFNQNDDGNSQYYIGLKCTLNGQGVNVGIFTDNSCSVEKADDVYLADAEFLQYQNETLIYDGCMNCAQVQGQNEDEDDEGEEDGDDDDGGDLYEVSEMCLVNYFESVKCEENLDIDYPSTEGCELISKLYMREDDYEPEDNALMEFSLHILIFVSVVFFAIIFRLCYIAQKQQRKMREDEMKWRNRLY